MTGIPQFNYPAFIAAANAFRAAGYDVVSPAELDDPDDKAAALASEDGHMLAYSAGTGKTWGDFLARDVKLLADDGITHIAVLPGWEKSRGARLETFVGFLCGLTIMEIVGITDEPGVEVVALHPLTLARAWAAEPYLSIEKPLVTR